MDFLFFHENLTDNSISFRLFLTHTWRHSILKKKYIVELTDLEREELNMCISKGENKAYKIKHVHILLKADVEGPYWPDKQIAVAFSCHHQTVYNVRRRFVEKGLSGAWVGLVAKTLRVLGSLMERRKVLVNGRSVFLLRS